MEIERSKFGFLRHSLELENNENIFNLSYLDYLTGTVVYIYSTCLFRNDLSFLTLFLIYILYITVW